MLLFDSSLLQYPVQQSFFYIVASVAWNWEIISCYRAVIYVVVRSRPDKYTAVFL